MVNKEVRDIILEKFEYIIESLSEDYDISFWDFKIEMIELNEDMSPGTTEVIRQYKFSSCEFCGARTMHYDKSNDMYICPKCLGKMKKGGMI